LAWFNVRVFPSSTGLAVYYRDVTDRKLSEQRLMAQYAVSRTLNAGYSLEDTGASLLAAIGTHLGWRVGQLWIRDKERRELSCAYCWQADLSDYGVFTQVSRSLKFARGEGFPGAVWASGQPQWVSDFAREYHFPRAQQAKEVTLHSGFAFPVFAGDEVVAVAEFLNPEIRQPDEELLRTVTAIGHQVGQYLERQSAVAALTESELRNSAIVETALDAIVTVDGDSRIVEFNPAAETTFGYKREDVIGKQMPELIIPPRFRDAHYAGLERYLHTGEAHVLGRRIELSAIRADGSEFPVELAITRVPLEGAILFTAYLRDITERKQNELERAQLLARAEGAQRYYQVLTEAIPQQVWTANPDGSLDFVNKGIAEYFGPPCGGVDWLGLGELRASR
jgi:PAS domain S-box-containing protein